MASSRVVKVKKNKKRRLLARAAASAPAPAPTPAPTAGPVTKRRRIADNGYGTIRKEGLKDGNRAC